MSLFLCVYVCIFMYWCACVCVCVCVCVSLVYEIFLSCLTTFFTMVDALFICPFTCLFICPFAFLFIQSWCSFISSRKSRFKLKKIDIQILGHIKFTANRESCEHVWNHDPGSHTSGQFTCGFCPCTLHSCR